jgi:DNA-binding CsgD family transcriptional regulator
MTTMTEPTGTEPPFQEDPAIPSSRSGTHESVSSQGHRHAACPKLAPREKEVLGYLAAGFTCRQTALHMQISPRTVETYLDRIRTKCRLATRAEMIQFAIRHGLA